MDQGFPNRWKRWGKEIFAGGEGLLGCGNLRMSYFDKSNLYQSWNHHPVNIEHQLKVKLAWHTCVQMKIK